MIDLVTELAIATQNFPRMVQANLGAVHQSMGVCQRIDRLRAKIVSLQGDDVNATWTTRQTFDQHKGWHVMQHPTQTADKTVTANRRKVMNRHTA